MSLPLLPRVLAQYLLNIHARSMKPRSDWDTLLKSMQFFLAIHLHPQSKASGGRHDIGHVHNRFCGVDSLHTVPYGVGENIPKIVERLLLNIRSNPCMRMKGYPFATSSSSDTIRRKAALDASLDAALFQPPSRIPPSSSETRCCIHPSVVASRWGQ